jgi:hypothetical protein
VALWWHGLEAGDFHRYTTFLTFRHVSREQYIGLVID